MKVIVGTDELPTPLISSIMYYVTYNPYWHAPDHLVRKTIAPNVLKLGPKYFSIARLSRDRSSGARAAKEVDPSTIDWKAAAAGKIHLLIRQDPGPLNSMGNLKFPFPNPEDIYLHDTPSKDLFAKDPRYLSNGCVRVEDALDLAAGSWAAIRSRRARTPNFGCNFPAACRSCSPISPLRFATARSPISMTITAGIQPPTHFASQQLRLKPTRFEPTAIADRSPAQKKTGPGECPDRYFFA